MADNDIKPRVKTKASTSRRNESIQATLNRPLAFPKDLWNTRFGWFWYNEEEIFDYSTADFDRKAEGFRKAGINHVITFSSTHFRWSYLRDWDLLTETLAKVVRACHKQGIYVTEHHSCHLTYNPVTPREEQALEPKLKRWPHLIEDCHADPIVIDDVRLSALRQIDGRTGSWARSSYRGWCMCYNNPHFRAAYFKYLAKLYETGIDGIMTDDVQWFGLQIVVDHVLATSHSCACQHCRRLFLEKTGFEMPSPGYAWDIWQGNYENASFRAWLEFRLKSTEDFHTAVKNHYESLGLRPLRPNYVSSVFSNNASGYCLETLPHLDWVFQETLASDIIRYSWPSWVPDTYHRFALARFRKIPPMVMFYPDRVDKVRFCWALAASWGVLYMGTPPAKTMIEGEKEIRAFESKHARLLRNPKRLAQIGFYDSRRNREMYKEAVFRSIPLFKAWIHACHMRNVPFDIFLDMEIDRLKRYRIVVLAEIAMLSDEEIAAFKEYVYGGGTLIWAGRTGSYTADGVRRSQSTLAELWNLTEIDCPKDDAPVQVKTLGKGRLVLMSGNFEAGEIENRYNIVRSAVSTTKNAYTPVPFRPPDAKAQDLRAQRIGLISSLLPGLPELRMENMPEGVCVTTFLSADDKSLVIHLVNASGLLDVPTGGPILNSDPIAPAEHAGPKPIVLRIANSDVTGQYRAIKAMVHNVDKDRDLEIEVRNAHGEISVTIDPAFIMDYALVEVSLESKA